LSAVANPTRWSGTEYALEPLNAYAFRFNDGFQVVTQKINGMSAMAVRPGDVPVVPEPETYDLMLAGLAGLALATRRRQR
jgi:hypothetical protein